MPSPNSIRTLFQDALKRIARLKDPERPAPSPERLKEGYAMLEQGTSPFYAAGSITALPLSPLARAARAADENFIPVWHGTTKNYDKVDPYESTEQFRGFHVGLDPSQANNRLGWKRDLHIDPDTRDSYYDGPLRHYLQSPHKRALPDSSYGWSGSEGANIMPLYVQPGKSFITPDLQHWKPQDLLTYTHPNRDPTEVLHDRYTATVREQEQKIKDALEAQGFSSIRYPNTVEGEAALDTMDFINDHYSGDLSELENLANAILLWDPRRVRSAHAVFDPANRNQPYLLGGSGGVTVGGALNQAVEMDTE